MAEKMTEEVAEHEEIIAFLTEQVRKACVFEQPEETLQKRITEWNAVLQQLEAERQARAATVRGKRARTKTVRSLARSAAKIMR